MIESIQINKSYCNITTVQLHFPAAKYIYLQRRNPSLTFSSIEDCSEVEQSILPVLRKSLNKFYRLISGDDTLIIIFCIQLDCCRLLDFYSYPCQNDAEIESNSNSILFNSMNRQINLFGRNILHFSPKIKHFFHSIERKTISSKFQSF